MSKSGPIVVVEDDLDNLYLFERIFQKLEVDNEVKFFRNGREALEYLLKGKNPYVIFSDINMPVMDGFEFKAAINANQELKNKSIPFIFLSTASMRKNVERAYELLVQGFFDKGNSYEELRDTIQFSLEYLTKSKEAQLNA